MRMRARCTETLSMMLSGRAKYTYSKMQGAWCVVATHCWLFSLPCSSMNTASPGAMSRTLPKPSMSSATDSEASMYSGPLAVSRRPSTNGRMPFGSRKPKMPWPMTIATTA